MAGNEENGKFSTDIGADVIRAALESVKKHTTHEEIPVEVEATEAPGATATAPAEPAESSEVSELKVQLELSQQKGRELMEKIKDTHEKMLRAVADLENYKKRALKEKEEVQKFGTERLLKDILPVLDNLERALAHTQAAGAAENAAGALKTGVEMVKKQFEDTLAKHGVKSFSAVGQPFDPRLHEAMSQKETAEVPPQHVVSEIVRGFTLNDRLVRPALVVVAVAPNPDNPKSA